MKRALMVVLVFLCSCAAGRKAVPYAGLKDRPMNPSETFGPSVVYCVRCQ